jgi:hypothetical protein
MLNEGRSPYTQSSPHETKATAEPDASLPVSARRNLDLKAAHTKTVQAAKK